MYQHLSEPHEAISLRGDDWTIQPLWVRLNVKLLGEVAVDHVEKVLLYGS